MTTIYDRSIWKKRAFRGYHPQYAKDQINEMRDDFETKRKQLEEELNKHLEENKQLRNKVEELKSSPNTESKTDHVLNEINQQIMERYLKGAKELLDAQNDIEQQRKELEEKIMVKEEERNQLVKRLKNGLQLLHEQQVEQ